MSNPQTRDKDSRAADVPAKYPPSQTPGRDEPFPKDSPVEVTNSDQEIEDKQTVSGD